MSQPPADASPEAPRAREGEPLFTGYSEFGEVLAAYVAREPAARGAILTDAEGDPVDFAHRPAEVSALDLQIVGAQVEQTTLRAQAWCSFRGLGRCEILIEASHGLVLSASPGAGCVLSSLQRPTRDPDPERLLASFAELRRRVAELIA
jgi:hypothetical protein